jgi:bacillopeptidase F (M6 metalloprotease family)
LLQRFGLLFPLYSNLSTFVKAYAQPINPQWFSNGARHLAEVKRLKDSLLVARENTQASQREGWAKTPLSSISIDTHNVVDDIFAGHTPSPVPLATHYAAPITRKSVAEATKARAEFAAKRGYSVEVVGNILTDNWFYGEAAMHGVIVSTSQAEPTHSTAFASFAILGGTGFLVHFLLRRFGL